jgi:glutaryl-CoA dehydrogenase (non-decarboxylating)
MDFNLSQEILILRDTVRKFAKEEVAPVAGADDLEGKFQRELVNKMAELGFFGCPIPEEYGGSDMGFLAHAIVTEEISRISGALRIAFNMQTMGTAREILQFGNEEQRKKWIPPLLNAELLGVIGITEPDAGTDTASMKSTAVMDGNEYILNGSKTWISYAPVADMGIVYAYTEPGAKHKGMSAFIVDLHTPGISARDLGPKMGLHSTPTGELFFEDARVPAENLLGEEGRGFKYMMASLDNTRLTAAAGAVGASQGLIDEAVAYSRDRVQFGQPIGKFQLIQEQIGRMVVETEASRLLLYRCAVQKDQGVSNSLETFMAKYYSCDVASRTADEALRILGAYGYSCEYNVERMLRDCKVYQILEGSANILKTLIGQDALGYRKANR